MGIHICRCLCIMVIPHIYIERGKGDLNGLPFFKTNNKRNMKRNINISDNAGAIIILESIKTNQKNRNHIVDLLYNHLSDHAISTIIDLAITDKEPTLVKKGDVIYFPNDEKYDIIDVDIDVLRDNNVYAGDNKLYAIIKDDQSYSSGFNPWYHKFDVDVISHDDNGKLILLFKSIAFERLKLADKPLIKIIHNDLNKKEEDLPF